MDAPTPKSPMLNIGREIGIGVFFVVYEGELNGNPVAIKKVRPTQLAERQQTLRDALRRAAFLLEQLSHPHIVKFFKLYASKEEGPLLVMEKMHHSLEEHFDLYSGKLSRERQIDFCLQIADAVHYLHSRQPPVVYRDLSPITVFVSPDGTLKLGPAIRASRMPSYGYSDVRPTGDILEVLEDHPRYNEKIDIFCFGALMLEIATHHLPSLWASAGISDPPMIDLHLKRLSHLPEDHPLKPIILQCLRDDPGERPNSGAVFRMLSEARPMLQAAYEEALNKHGSVSVGVIPCIFVGPPAVGKSTLKHLLVHNKPKAVKTSTAVMATPEVVTISSEHYAVGGGTSAWQLVDNDVMEKSLRACINTRAFDGTAKYPSEAEVKKWEHVRQESSPFEQGSTGTLPLSSQGTLVHQQHSNSTQTQADTDQGSFPQVNPIALLNKQHFQLLQKLGGECESIKLKNASFIHLMDTGGQPSFQDALPLLLDVPCTYIQVFNAAHDLDQPVPNTYRCDDHTEESLPPSAETGWEMMLRSFSSMQTMAQKHAKDLATFQQEGNRLPQLHIFVVGTFKDQLVKEDRLKEAVRDISKRLKELDGKPYYHCIQRDSKGRPFYLIDNTVMVEEDERAYVNSLREHLSTARGFLKLKVPVVWYVCEQVTQGTAQKFFRFQDLKAFCLEQRFIDANGADEQFRSLLKLFSLLGFYTFFDLKDFPDEANYVCTDKGVFLKEVSKLLAVQFFKSPRCHAVEVFKRDGIISDNEKTFEELGIIAEVNRSWFLAALEHVGLLARYASATDSSPSYFMPIALPQGKTKLPDRGSVASLCVTFTFHSPDNPLVYTDLPRGVFCRLAVELSKGPWAPIPKTSDRTTVKFHSKGKEFELYLTEAPGFIRLTPVLVEELEGEEPVAELHKLCSEMYDTLRKSIIPSAEDVLGELFHQTTKIEFGFECSCGNVPHLAILASSKAKSLICQAGKKERRKLLDQEQIWFASVEYSELKFLPHQKFWSLETSPCRQKLSDDTKSDTILSQKVYDRPDYLMLFRKHVSRRAAGKGSAVLEGVGLDAPTIQTCFLDHPQSVEEAVHTGLIKWSSGQGLPPTWEVLLQDMEHAEIGQQHNEGLRTALGLHA